MCGWFDDNKLSVHFGQGKTKSSLFGTKYRLQNAKALSIVYNGTKIKQYEKVKYLGCILDQSVSGESMALNVIDKVNLRLKFLHRQNRLCVKTVKTPPLRRMLCDALIQPLFDYACTAWFSDLSKRLKLRLQASQNKCIRFCLQLDKRSKTRAKEFLQLNWLNVHNRYLQFIVSDIFRFQNDQCPDYFDELFCPVGENGVITCSSNQKFTLPFRNTKLRIQSLSYLGPNTWNSLPDNLKSATSVNSFKDYIKEYFLKKLGNVEADIYSYT